MLKVWDVKLGMTVWFGVMFEGTYGKCASPRVPFTLAWDFKPKDIVWQSFLTYLETGSPFFCVRSTDFSAQLKLHVGKCSIAKLHQR